MFLQNLLVTMLENVMEQMLEKAHWSKILPLYMLSFGGLALILVGNMVDVGHICTMSQLIHSLENVLQ